MERSFKGTVVRATGSWYEVLTDGGTVRCRIRGRLRLEGRRSTNPVVVGDEVGASYSFNENLAIDASYRFVGLGYNEVSAYHNGQKYEVGNDPYNNEFMLGLRFAF